MATTDSHPDLNHSSKDCRNCNKRRVRCDRTLPFCFKCSKKGLTCTGYRRELRWTNAIASRGRFRGLGAPVPPEQSPPQDEDASIGDDLLNSTHGSTSDVSPAVTSNFTPEGHGESDMPSDMRVMVVTELFDEPIARGLLTHYSTTITPINVWFDSDQNEYRSLIMPLAEQHPVLKLAILATSATHAPADTRLDERLITSACETAIAMITEKVKQLAGPDVDETTLVETEVANVEAVLAAILVLSNYALLRADIRLAQFHRQAARVLVKTLACVTDSRDEIYVFLRNQVAAYDILACTALFNADHIRHVVLPESNFSLFGLFLKLVHAITIWPLQLVEKDAPFPSTSLTELENQFEIARGATLLSAGSLINSRTDSFKLEFIQLVSAYHHAGILYAHKRAQIFPFDENAQHHVNRLFEALDRLKDMSLILANIAWPLFVAGLCCCDDPGKIQKIRNFYRILSANTRYRYYDDISGALTVLWESSHRDWVIIARECEDRGEPIVPL